MPAKTVFRECINYLKEQLLNVLENKWGTTFTLDDIHWVLTVPAIWSDAAKEFMRESATEVSLFPFFGRMDPDQQSEILGSYSYF